MKHPNLDRELRKKRTKFNAKRREYDGYKFDSTAEYLRYLVLKDKVSNGEIRDLEVHPFYTIYIKGIKIGKVILDFRYFDINLDKLRIEDVKGLDTTISKWKRKTVEADFGIKVELPGYKPKKRKRK